MTRRLFAVFPLTVALPFVAHVAAAQATDTVRVAYSAARCPRCAEWLVPHAPMRVFGNTYYVGTNGLSSILITSPDGDVLIDGAIPQAAPLIAANIRALGISVEDVRLILNSHDHHDHAGGLAQLARLSGARVAASAKSARVLERGESDASDPQFGLVLPYPPVHVDQIVTDGETLHVGPIAITAHLTPGHTPGGTSWSWRSCDAASTRCVDVVYADSQTPVSADGFFYTRSTTYPTGIQDFQRGLDLLEHLPCDILLTPHPGASHFWERIAARDRGDSTALIDRSAMGRFVAAAREAVRARVEREKRGG